MNGNIFFSKAILLCFDPRGPSNLPGIRYSYVSSMYDTMSYKVSADEATRSTKRAQGLDSDTINSS